MALTPLPVGLFIYKTLGFLTVAVHTSISNKHYAKQMRELEITTTRSAAIAHVGEPGFLGQNGAGGRSAQRKLPFLVSRSQQSAKTSLYFGACVCERVLQELEAEHSWRVFIFN